jgi:hypothetical protein
MEQKKVVPIFSLLHPKRVVLSEDDILPIMIKLKVHKQQSSDSRSVVMYEAELIVHSVPKPTRVE